MRWKLFSVVLAAILIQVGVAGPAAAGTDSPWVHSQGKAGKGRFLHSGDWLQVCDLKKKDKWAAGIFLFGKWSDGDEYGAVFTSRPGGCAKAAYNFVLMEGVEIRVKVCKVRQNPLKITGCSRFTAARA
ncbi:hypothetical protein [Actinocorallia lasiicapitis]